MKQQKKKTKQNRKGNNGIQKTRTGSAHKKKCKLSNIKLDIECLVNEYKEQHEKMNLRALMSNKYAES